MLGVKYPRLVSRCAPPVEPHVEGGEGGQLVDHGRDLRQPVVPAGRGQGLQGNTGKKFSWIFGLRFRIKCSQPFPGAVPVSYKSIFTPVEHLQVLQHRQLYSCGCITVTVSSSYSIIVPLYNCPTVSLSHCFTVSRGATSF